MTERDELAKLAFIADNHAAGDPHAEWEFLQKHPKYTAYVYEIADAILAAGYRKTEVRWAETLTNDGTYEYTISSDCDGSSVQHWRRLPGKTYIEDASPWEAHEPEVAA